MEAPHEFLIKVQEMLDHKKRVEQLQRELCEWIAENSGDGCYINDIVIADEPSGEPQGEDEYCDQWTGYCEDDFSGVYYHKIEDSDKWFAYHYSC